MPPGAATVEDHDRSHRDWTSGAGPPRPDLPWCRSPSRGEACQPLDCPKAYQPLGGGEIVIPDALPFHRGPSAACTVGETGNNESSPSKRHTCW